MAEIKYTELDFALIKENLKNFLKSQDKFKDYNFDGSGLSILLDVLAYNTSYNGFYLNMIANEMFLDSASLRESVLSRAKHLGYVPRSRSALKAYVDFQVSFLSEDAVLPTNFLLSNTQEFYTNYNDSRYTFYPVKSVYFEKLADRQYIARNVELIEGKRLSHTYTVDTTSAVKQRFIIPNSGVDTSTLVVSVKESATSSNITVFRQATDITTVSATSASYFLQPYQADQYEVVFGDDIIGKAVVDGNVVVLEYLVSSGDGATGASIFRTGKLNNITVVGNQTSVVTTISAANGYAEEESIDTIKLLAPRSYEAQNRAVTKYDYETLLLKDVSTIEYVRVWGGEENVPPEYGKVFCAIKPKTGTSLNYDDRNRILTTFIKPRNLVSLEVVIIEPEYIGVMITSVVNYDSNKTTSDANIIKSLVFDAIDEYKTTHLNGFDSDFRFSKLTKFIDDADPSIESNVTDVTIKYKVIPTLNTRNKFSIVLNNEIDRGDFTNNISAVTSSSFYYNNARVSLADDGEGTLFMYYVSNDSTKIIVESKVGTVDYASGTITIENLLVTSISDNLNYINFYVMPKYNDVIALRNQMILIQEEDIDVTVVDIQKLKLS